MIKVTTFLMMNHETGSQEQVVSIAVMCKSHQVVKCQGANYRIVNEMLDSGVLVDVINSLKMAGVPHYLSVEHFAQKVRVY